MRTNSWLAFWTTLAITVPSAGAEDCPVFVLHREAEGLRVVRETVRAEETRVWAAGGATGILDLVLPVGPGTSGALLRAAEPGAHIVHCTGSALEHRYRRREGSEDRRPSRELSSLRREDIRVSIVEPGRRGRAVRISGYDTIVEDQGPVLNLFAGVPLALDEGDVIVTTETSRRWRGESVTGEIAIEADRHLFARGSVPDGGDGWLLVDTGGAGTLLSRDMLPPDAEVEEAAMVEYSAAGKRLLPYTPGGATGPVLGIVGHVTLERLEVGGLVFTDVRAAVVDAMPQLFARPVEGVVGLDLLRRNETLVLEVPPGGKGEGRLGLGPRRRGSGSSAIAVPFTVVKDLLVTRSQIGGRDVHLIVDTGAPGLLLDEGAAEAAGVSGLNALPTDLRGLDGGKAAGRAGVAEGMRLGAAHLADLSVMIAPLPVFAILRTEEQKMGLLGNDVLGRFQRIEIVWQAQEMYLTERPPRTDTR